MTASETLPEAVKPPVAVPSGRAMLAVAVADATMVLVPAVAQEVPPPNQAPTSVPRYGGLPNAW